MLWIHERWSPSSQLFFLEGPGRRVLFHHSCRHLWGGTFGLLAAEHFEPIHHSQEHHLPPHTWSWCQGRNVS